MSALDPRWKTIDWNKTQTFEIPLAFPSSVSDLPYPSFLKSHTALRGIAPWVNSLIPFEKDEEEADRRVLARYESQSTPRCIVVAPDNSYWWFLGDGTTKCVQMDRVGSGFVPKRRQAREQRIHISWSKAGVPNMPKEVPCEFMLSQPGKRLIHVDSPPLGCRQLPRVEE